MQALAFGVGAAVYPVAMLYRANAIDAQWLKASDSRLNKILSEIADENQKDKAAETAFNLVSFTDGIIFSKSRVTQPRYFSFLLDSSKRAWTLTLQDILKSNGYLTPQPQGADWPVAAAAGLFAGAIAHTAVHSLHSNTTAMDKFVAEYKRQVVSFLEQPTSEERKGLLRIAAVRLAIYAYVVSTTKKNAFNCLKIV